ncbi:hypothetical protein [Corallococcus exiguus]|uniref:Lipoprotein n=1 Tax=Corallococcus exiguus TaxID=83462 RepID=A0A7X4Y963_9BACT|nr:hypothetical protein [Corallococcus exiguus]NBC40975.1 hypothetical protein [Corallococcus exiguus]TNV63125.1 hypothetical protein FH620_16175 [Corallococcus exiguus]
MRRRLVRGLGLFAALGLAGCGGPIEEGTAAELGAQEQELRLCPDSGICPAGEVCYFGPGGACYPCRQYPQYCELD